MSDHVRTQIRRRVVADLQGIASGGVESSRVYSTDDGQTLSVSTPTDVVDDRREAPPGEKLGRALTLIVEARTKGVSGYEDVLDTLCAGVESALANDPDLGGLVEKLDLQQTTTEFSGESDEPVGLATMEYAAHCRVAATDPTTIID